jgi:ligand-binding SRPBCC domain-containing protein
MGPVWQRWIAEHRDYEESRQFRDVQIAGPFAQWEHTHWIEPLESREIGGSAMCHLEDRIEYVLPFGLLGRVFGGAFTRNKLERVFRYRHVTTQQDVAAHYMYR